MIFYLLLIVVSGLLVLASVALGIFGLIKKRKNLAITASILFLAGAIGCVFFTFAYTRKAIEYVRSNEFQHDAGKGAELVGKTFGSATSGMSNGLVTTLDENAMRKLAGRSAHILGSVTRTVASNLDSTLGHKDIFLDSTLAKTGVSLGRADEISDTASNNLAIFIDYKKDFKGKLRITNFDQTGQKIEVADKEVSVKAGHSNIEVFNFFYSNLGLTTYYIMSLAE